MDARHRPASPANKCHFCDRSKLYEHFLGVALCDGLKHQDPTSQYVIIDMLPCRKETRKLLTVTSQEFEGDISSEQAGFPYLYLARQVALNGEWTDGQPFSFLFNNSGFSRTRFLHGYRAHMGEICMECATQEDLSQSQASRTI